jgi:alpha-mannosidase
LSLLRSPKWPDPTADRGKHEITYSLYPHRGGWQDGNTVRRGYELNNALLPVVTDGHKGTLPATGSFVSLDPPSCVLTTMKKAEDSDAWIIQWYNTSGERVRATVRLPRTPSKVLTSNFLEEDGTPLRCKEEGVTVETVGHGVTTIKVVF